MSFFFLHTLSLSYSLIASLTRYYNVPGIQPRFPKPCPENAGFTLLVFAVLTGCNK